MSDQIELPKDETRWIILRRGTEYEVCTQSSYCGVISYGIVPTIEDAREFVETHKNNVL